jgi:hypothetical protein
MNTIHWNTPSKATWQHQRQSNTALRTHLTTTHQQQSSQPRMLNLDLSLLLLPRQHQSYRHDQTTPQQAHFSAALQQQTRQPRMLEPHR